MQEKLQELEAKLSIVSSLPAGSPHHHLHSECIQQRFAFLKNLLSAEIACRPSKPSHLGHIGKRLAELEIAFREYWDVQDRSRRSVGDMNIYFDTVSVCSCDESSLEDDGEATIDLTSPELGFSEDELEPQLMNSPRPLLMKVKSQRSAGRESSSSDEEVLIEGQGRKKNSPWEKVNFEKLQGSSEHDHDRVQQHSNKNTLGRMKAKVGNDEVYVEKKEGRISWSGKYWGTLISGMTLGMFLMGAGAAIAMVGDSGSFYSTPPHDGLLFYT